MGVFEAFSNEKGVTLGFCLCQPNSMKYLIFAMFAMYSVDSFAQSASIECKNLYAATCIPTTRDDGTGISYSPGDTKDRLDRAAAVSKDKLMAEVRKFLGDENNEHLRDLILKAQNLDEDICEEPHERARCNEAAQQGLFELVRKAMFGPGHSGDHRSYKLEDIAPVVLNARFQEMVTRVSDDLENSVLKPDDWTRIKDKVFPRVKDQVIARLETLPIEEKVKKRMIAKIKNIRYMGNDCSKLGENTMNPGAFYQPAQNGVYLCKGNLLSTTSEFAIVQALAHEIGHAIDPCNIAAPDAGIHNYVVNDPNRHWEDQYPIPGLAKCLRGSDSARSTVNPVPKPPMPTAPGGFYTGPYTTYPGGQYGQPAPMPPQQPTPFKGKAKQRQVQYPAGQPGPPYVQGPYSVGIPPEYAGYFGGQGGAAAPPVAEDPHAAHSHRFDASSCTATEQLGEAVPDWLAAEVLPRYMSAHHKLTPEQYRAGYSNAWSWNCEKNYKGDQRHPATETRTNAILAANPEVRKQMDCAPDTSKFRYCSGTADDPAAAPYEIKPSEEGTTR